MRCPLSPSLGPAIAYAAAHHVQLVSVDTIVGVGKVYMVVRASNTIYGLDACAYISSKVKSGYVLDLEGDLRLNETILRYMVTKIDPSVGMSGACGSVARVLPAASWA